MSSNPPDAPPPRSRRNLKKLGVTALIVVLSLASLGLMTRREATYRLELRDEESCVGCHAGLHMTMVRQWKDSAHFTADVGCADCHGTDHEAIFGANGEVSAAQCAAECHLEDYEEFKKSKHSHPMTGKKADTLAKYPDETGSCTFSTGCHAVRKTYPDESRGKCSVCHPSHGFSLEVTRDPSTCITCHSGTNNTEVVEYEKSMHGILYRTVGLKGGGANCTTCHMPNGNHDDGFNTTDLVLADNQGQGGIEKLRFVRTMGREEFNKKREAMLQICQECHGRKLAKRALEEADAFRKQGAFMLEEAAAIVHALDREKLLVPEPDRRTPNPLTKSALLLGAGQLFDREMSAAERIFYNMYMFTYSGAWRRAYHNLPALVRWHENEMLKDNLIMLQAEATRLRALDEIRKKLDGLEVKRDPLPQPASQPVNAPRGAQVEPPDSKAGSVAGAPLRRPVH